MSENLKKISLIIIGLAIIALSFYFYQPRKIGDTEKVENKPNELYIGNNFSVNIAYPIPLNVREFDETGDINKSIGFYSGDDLRIGKQTRIIVWIKNNIEKDAVDTFVRKFIRDNNELSDNLKIEKNKTTFLVGSLYPDDYS